MASTNTTHVDYVSLPNGIDVDFLFYLHQLELTLVIP